MSDVTDNQPGNTATPDGTQQPYQLNVATNTVPMQRDHLGRPYWESYMTPDSYKVYAKALVPPHLPGIIIFVHGVNSEGEWYDHAEQQICAGLSKRLGRTDLSANTYIDTDPSGKPSRRIVKQLGRSPVIRFYWGYRAADGDEQKWKIPLRNTKGDDRWKDSVAGKKGP
jgi:hypothetical protein